jgi:hypothetical protein
VKKLIVCVFLIVGACHDRTRPPEPTPEQLDQLNEADQMLNEMAQNEEGPEANASGPSNSSD